MRYLKGILAVIGAGTAGSVLPFWVTYIIIMVSYLVLGIDDENKLNTILWACLFGLIPLIAIVVLVKLFKGLKHEEYLEKSVHLSAPVGALSSSGLYAIVGVTASNGLSYFTGDAWFSHFFKAHLISVPLGIIISFIMPALMEAYEISKANEEARQIKQREQQREEVIKAIGEMKQYEMDILPFLSLLARETTRDRERIEDLVVRVKDDAQQLCETADTLNEKAKSLECLERLSVFSK